MRSGRLVDLGLVLTEVMGPYLDFLSRIFARAVFRWHGDRMIYLEQRPPSDLAPWVACFWQISGESAGAGHRVLPDGCADWLLDLQAARHRQSELQLVGTMSTAQLVPLHGAVDLMGIRLRPGVLGALRLPAAELLDAIVPARELAGAPRLSSEQLAQAASLPLRAELLAGALRELLASNTPRPDPLVREVLAAWSSPQTSFPRVGALTRQLHVSERALERRFRTAVGLTPAGYRRLARFRAVLRLHTGGLRDWAGLAVMAGFSDQSHLVREFGALAGLSPTAWAAEQAGPAGFLQDGIVCTS
jgi:AraC-like DNA-binding protein